VRFILPKAIADVFITDQVSNQDIRPVLAAMTTP
jgi:3-dehydroquinate synthase